MDVVVDERTPMCHNVGIAHQLCVFRIQKRYRNGSLLVLFLLFLLRDGGG